MRSPERRGFREGVKRLVEDTDTPLGRAFDLSIQVLIVISLVTFAWETVPGTSGMTVRWLRITEVVVVMIFTAEYLLRLWVADRPWRFASSFYGLVDLVAILPFYLTLGFDLRGLDLRSIRIVRLLRIVRVLKVARYSAAVARFGRAYHIAKEEMVLFLSASMIALYIAAVGIYYFEHPAQPDVFSSVPGSLWWAVATLTTVGYGDIYPITAGGRVFTTCMLFIGLGIIAVPAGVIASALSKAREME